MTFKHITPIANYLDAIF